MIPVLSVAAGIDVRACGRLLEPITIEEIRRQVAAVAALPATELRTMARAAWEHARSTHTGERYAQEYGRIFDRSIRLPTTAAEIAHRISGARDQWLMSLHKQGHFLPGTHVQIRHPDHVRETRP